MSISAVNNKPVTFNSVAAASSAVKEVAASKGPSMKELIDNAANTGAAKADVKAEVKAADTAASDRVNDMQAHFGGVNTPKI